jgi:hypothetical protein
LRQSAAWIFWPSFAQITLNLFVIEFLQKDDFGRRTLSQFAVKIGFGFGKFRGPSPMTLNLLFAVFEIVRAAGKDDFALAIRRRG